MLVDCHAHLCDETFARDLPEVMGPFLLPSPVVCINLAILFFVS